MAHKEGTLWSGIDISNVFLKVVYNWIILVTQIAFQFWIT